MSTPFVDQSERDYTREREAGERLQHLKLVRREAAGGEDADEEQVVRLLKDFSDSTEAANFLVAYFARTEKHFPDTNPTRNFLDALIGASAGTEDWFPLKDEELAARMGCSTRTLARVRAAVEACPGHTKLLDIKPNWRHPDTLESFPHSYRLKVHRLAAETVFDARIDAQHGRDRGAAFEASAEVTAMAAQGFVARPPKRRKAKSQAELLMADAEAVVKRLKAASARPVSAGHVNYERLEDLHHQMREALAEFEDAFGFESGVSMQSSYRGREEVDTVGSAPLDVEPDGRRVDAENSDFPHVDKMSTREKHDFSPPEDDDPAPFRHRAPAFVRVKEGAVWSHPPPAAPPGLLLAIGEEVRRVEARLEKMARGRREGGCDATVVG